MIREFSKNQVLVKFSDNEWKALQNLIKFKNHLYYGK
ncbi:MAG: hypothetical protein ACD_2C00116G0002 [uncultured bacterium (gcode 4)]|uniref:Uncharacterized protein n=1 Tax=uncultured bacterium (gcode 4) TaxID=1234023 RepID=K2GH21_9BACT|nr:MAG: hypothetical protein ACD_2C00116G0002 [uncultured bacterium (gcode 4)]